VRIWNKDGKQIGVQDGKGKNYFFENEDNLNPPQKVYIGQPPKKKKTTKKEE